MSPPANHDINDLFASWHTDLDTRLRFALPPNSTSHPVRPAPAKTRQDWEASSNCSFDELSIGDKGVQAQYQVKGAFHLADASPLDLDHTLFSTRRTASTAYTKQKQEAQTVEKPRAFSESPAIIIAPMSQRPVGRYSTSAEHTLQEASGQDPFY